MRKFEQSLSKINWNSFYSACDADYMSELLCSTYSQLIDTHFPLKKVSDTKCNPPVNWFTDSLRQKRDFLSTVRIVCEAEKSSGYINIYKQLKREYQKEITLTKRAAFNNFINNSDNKSKDSWRLINYELARHHRHDSSKISSEEFNVHFSKIAEDIISKINPQKVGVSDIKTAINHLGNTLFEFQYITEDMVLYSILHLKNTSSMDIYNINSKMVKETKHILVPLLTYLFNTCVSSGTFPESLQCAKVVPLFKKGNKSDVNNYRPISIIPIFGKLLEIILKELLLDHLMHISFFSERQWGFLPGKSTVEAVRVVISDIIEGLEEGNHILLALYDISKAFDCVSHDLLMDKLVAIGLTDNTISFFKSYFDKRCQVVNMNGVVSSVLPQRHGVPQGSVLGPLFFLIYVNGFPDFISPTKCNLFADDTTVIVKSPEVGNLGRLSDEEEERARKWFANHKLLLNSDKTQKLIISTRPSIAERNSVTLLGITIDDRLTWCSHVDILCNKLSTVLYILRKLKQSLDVHVLRTVYYALFHSKMQYGLNIWGASSEATRVFKMQKKAIRIIMGLGFRDSCRSSFSELQIMPLPSVYMYVSLLEVRKNLANLTLQSDLHTIGTRNSHLLRLPRYRLSKSQKNSLNLKLFNVLPESFKNMEELAFKNSIKQLFLTNSFYSCEEYFSHLG
nr:unnamed protein product [Callosobruchus chinensis]